MTSTIIILWSISNMLTYIFALIMSAFTMKSTYNKLRTVLAYITTIFMLSVFTYIWYSKFIMNDAIPIIVYSIMLSVLGYVLYKESLSHIIFINTTIILVINICTFLFCGTTDQLLGKQLELFTESTGPYTICNILLFIGIKILVLTTLTIIYSIFIKKLFYKLTNIANGQLKNYLIIPISSLISFSGLTYITNNLDILPTNIYFIPLYILICSIYISEYIVLSLSIYWTAKAINAEQIMYIDGLTGLSNRTAFDMYEEKLDKAINDGNAKFSLIMIDLNFLKKMNDTYGHDKGDIAIKILADDIKTMFTGCKCFRIGGDEFAVIISGKDVDTLSFLLTTMGSSISRTGKPNEWENISASLGHTVYMPDRDKSFHDVFVRADAIMYENKKKMKAVRKD